MSRDCRRAGGAARRLLARIALGLGTLVVLATAPCATWLVLAHAYATPRHISPAEGFARGMESLSIVALVSFSIVALCVYGWCRHRHSLGRVLSLAEALLLVVVLISWPRNGNATHVDARLSARLPAASALPSPALMGMPDSVAAATWPGRPADDRWAEFAFGRPGPVGARSYIIGNHDWSDPPASGPSADVEIALYERASVGAAQSFWRERPPERADRSRASNVYDASEAEIRAGLPHWRFTIRADDGSDWQGVCLAGDERGCAGFHGWVRFCRYAMEIDFSPPRWDWDLHDPRVPQIMRAIADATAARVGCTDGSLRR